MNCNSCNLDSYLDNNCLTYDNNCKEPQYNVIFIKFHTELLPLCRKMSSNLF